MSLFWLFFGCYPARDIKKDLSMCASNIWQKQKFIDTILSIKHPWRHWSIRIQRTWSNCVNLYASKVCLNYHFNALYQETINLCIFFNWSIDNKIKQNFLRKISKCCIVNAFLNRCSSNVTCKRNLSTKRI